MKNIISFVANKGEDNLYNFNKFKKELKLLLNIEENYFFYITEKNKSKDGIYRKSFFYYFPEIIDIFSYIKFKGNNNLVVEKEEDIFSINCYKKNEVIPYYSAVFKKIDECEFTYKTFWEEKFTVISLDGEITRETNWKYFYKNLIRKEDRKYIDKLKFPILNESVLLDYLSCEKGDNSYTPYSIFGKSTSDVKYY
jgi:hypothetical protein